MSSRCRSCQAPVIWAETVGGKRIPVDAEPSPVGNATLTDRPGRDPLFEVLVGEGLDLFQARAGERLYISHFATCPQAGAWRSA